MEMTIVKAAAVQLSPVLYSREGTVEKVVDKIAELGRLGVSLLMRLIEGQRLDAMRIELATTLIVRDSTGPAPRG